MGWRPVLTEGPVGVGVATQPPPPPGVSGTLRLVAFRTFAAADEPRPSARSPSAGCGRASQVDIQLTLSRTPPPPDPQHSLTSAPAGFYQPGPGLGSCVCPKGTLSSSLCSCISWFLCGSLLPLEGQAHSLCISLKGTKWALRTYVWNQRPKTRVEPRPAVSMCQDSREGPGCSGQCLGLRCAGSQRKGVCRLRSQVGSLPCPWPQFFPPGKPCAGTPLSQAS